MHDEPAGDPATPPLLEANGVSVRFGGVRALTDVTVTMRANAITGLVGPNGAGKTTLFGVLSGLLRPTSGRVFMDGDDITVASPQRRARRGLARTFQRPQLFSSLTVRQHLALAHRLANRRSSFWRNALGFDRRYHSDEEDTRVVELASTLGLEPLLDTPVDSLGLGTSRVVEVARALATDPRVLLLDEPSSGLDSRETDQLAEVLVSVQREQGVALVLVEHDLELVMALSHDVYVLDFGQLIAAGSPDEVRADPAVQAAYIGTAS